MRIYWRNTELNEELKPYTRPPIHPLDVYMAIERKSADEHRVNPDTSVHPFRCHDKIQFKLFLKKLNNLFGRQVYCSTDELVLLGIVLNKETGYLIHVNSTSNIEHNFSFTLTSRVNDELSNIIEHCDLKENTFINVGIVKMWVKNLFEDNNFKLILKNRKPYFTVNYHTQLSEETKYLSKRNDPGNVNLYSEPDPLLPVFNSYQCEICLKSTCNFKTSMQHINLTHDVIKGLKSTDLISPSYGQDTPSGILTVLMSERFIEIEKNISASYKNTIPPYFIPEVLPPVKKINEENIDVGYSINTISEFDEMFNFNYIVKFMNNLHIKDFNYYLDYCKMDVQYRKMEEYLTKLIYNIIVFQTRKYEYDSTLTTHRSRVLKFYISSAPYPSFTFGKVSNPERVLKYAKYISKTLMMLHASYNLSRKNMRIYCENPYYKVCFTHAQKSLMKKVFKYIISNYKTENIKMFDADTTKDLTRNVHLHKHDLEFWKKLQEFFINITLQKKGKYTPLQAIFSFSSVTFDYNIKRLNFHRPPKRSQIFKSLLYIIRLSFLSVVNHTNDEYYNALINETTFNGEIRRVMEKLYYPTLYYFLKRKQHMVQSFFNPEKFTYVHPVCFIDKFIGCKILGLHSINIMMQKTMEYLTSEYMFIQKFVEIQCDYDDIHSISRIVDDYESDIKRNRPIQPNLLTVTLSKDLNKSISGITSLLIGYLALSNRPLSKFREYLEITSDAFKFSDDLLTISTHAFTMTVEDEYAIRCFKYYQVLRIFMFKIDEKLDRDLFFIRLSYVKGPTFMDLMECKYTTYRHLYLFLRNCHDTNDSRGSKFAKPWMELVKNSLRERSESYLIINLKLIAIENQRFMDPNDLNKIATIDEVDPRSYIAMDSKVNLKDLIESGFLDYQFLDEEDKEYIDPPIEEDTPLMILNSPSEMSDQDDYEGDPDQEIEYDNMITIIKSHLKPTINKRIKV